jgi:hypothetical protein
VTDATPLLDSFKRGEVAREARLLAAQGALAPRAHEQLLLLVLLVEDADLEVRAAAEETLKRIPAEALTVFLGRPDVPAGLREFFAGRGILPDEAAPPVVPADADAPLIAVAAEGDELGEEGDSEGTVIQRLAAMSFTGRLKAAVHGSREMRSILVRDSNRMIAAAVLSSPKVSEPEIESFARMANVSEDVLRTIARNRGWMKNYGIVLALTKNAKTPVAVSMHLMARLNGRDLQKLAVDRNIPEPLRVAARRKVVESASKT